jgi:hypothetical protein
LLKTNQSTYFRCHGIVLVGAVTMSMRPGHPAPKSTFDGYARNELASKTTLPLARL